MNAEASLFREGLAQFRILLCRQVAGHEVGIHIPQSLLILSPRSNRVDLSAVLVSQTTHCHELEVIALGGLDPQHVV